MYKTFINRGSYSQIPLEAALDSVEVLDLKTRNTRDEARNANE